MQADRPASRRILTLYRLRWLVPLALSLLGLAYVLGETFILHEHVVPHSQRQVLTGVIMLSIVGPVIAYLGLNWALRISTRLEKAEGTLREQNRQLAIISEVSKVANSTLEVDQLLNKTLASLLQLIDVESGAIWLRNEDRLVLKASRGMSETFLIEEQVQDLSDCLCSQALQGELPLTLENLKCGRDYITARCNCEQFEAAVGVPVRTGDEVVGILELATNQPREFGLGDLELLSTVGHQLGSALEKAQLHSQLEQMNEALEQLVQERTGELIAARDELAQKAETLKALLLSVQKVEEKTRARIAGDLHDGLQQLLNGALFEVQAVREALQVSPGATRQELQRLEDILQKIAAELRNAIYSLRPVTLESLGLVSALQECARSFEKMAGIPCNLKVDGTLRRFDQDAELVAFRIVQEALNNIETHAGASQSTVHLQFNEDRLHLEVEDDGRGFELPSDNNGPVSQLGLIGMQERATSVGGRLQVQSSSQAGTRITLELPLGRNQQ